MEEILKDWKKKAKRDEEKNLLFIKSLKFKDRNKVDAAAKKLHKEAFEKIDCLKCGNCCRVSRPLLEEEDIKRISKYLNITKVEFTAEYLEKDKYGDFFMKKIPCSFFNEEDNTCQIYEVRPKDCQEFPHTQKDNFASRSFMHSWNTEVCPATFYIVEKLKERF